MQVGSKVNSRELAAILASGQSSATYRTSETADHLERVVNFRRLSGAPFQLIVGEAMSDFLADWRLQVQRAVAAGACFVLMVLFFIGGLWRSFKLSVDAKLESDRLLKERNAVADALGAQSRLLKEIVESLPFGLVVFDENRIRRFANSKFMEILQLPTAAMDDPHYSFYDFLSFCDQRGDYTDGEPLDQRYQRLSEMMVARRLQSGERQQSNGALIEFRAYPISNGWTAITYLDNTERRRAQYVLAETQARVRLATESAGIGIWELNLSTGQLHWDAQQYRLYGMEPDSGSADYAMWAQSVHPDDLPICEAAYRKAIDDHTDFVADFRIIWRNGEIRHIRALGRLDNDANGKPVRMIGTNRDITDALSTANSLKEARDRAEQANISKGYFLANMSHEIRTPMNAILGLLQLLGRTNLQPTQSDYVKKITLSAKALLGLLNDILDFSKIEADKLDLLVEPFVVDALLQDVGVVLHAYVGVKPVEVIYDIDPHIPHSLVGDALRLRQILVNLGGNGIKFTSSGQVVIGVKRLPGGPPGEVLLEFSVQDTGIGIAPDKLPLLFGSFSQAEATTTRRFGGTGLGLAICKKLLQLMGGAIQVTSSVGTGSRFVFQLSLPEASPPESVAPKGAGKVILLIDDNATTRAAVASIWRCTAPGSRG